MQEVSPIPIDEYVNGAVLYKDDRRSVTLSHLAGEWKGPGKNMVGARLQSAYDAGTRPFPAEVTTFTTDGNHDTLEYHQYLIKSTSLTGSHQGLKDGRRGLRNEQDHAREQSYALKDRLVKHWKQRGRVLQPVAEGAQLVPDDALITDFPRIIFLVETS